MIRYTAVCESENNLLSTWYVPLSMIRYTAVCESENNLLSAWYVPLLFSLGYVIF
jgi:hypothetical protein